MDRRTAPWALVFLSFCASARAAPLGARIKVQTPPLRVQTLKFSGVDPRRLPLDWTAAPLLGEPPRLTPTTLVPARLAEHAVPFTAAFPPAETAQVKALTRDEDAGVPRAPEGRGAGGFKAVAQRVGVILSRIVHPFGASAAPAPVSVETLATLDVGTPVEFTYRGERRRGVVLDVTAKSLLVVVEGKKAPQQLALRRISEVSVLPGPADLGSLSAEHGLDVGMLKSRLAARRAYARFLRKDHWAERKDAIQAEVASLRSLGSKQAVPAYVRGAGEDILARVREKHGTANVGFHYNLHGGQAEEYVEGGGIHATMGDIALNYTMHGDTAHKVYFFQSAMRQLYDILDERHPNLYSSRMGHVLNVFRLDSAVLQKALQDGAASNFTTISIDFDRAKLEGIRYETYLAPPLDVFNGVSRKVGLRLSRDEETLAVMRYLEAVLLDPESFIP